LAEKKLKLGTPIPEARKPNEGSKQDKKWNAAKPLSKDDEEDSYIQGKGEKAKRERQRKEKNKIDVDMRYVEPSRGGDRGRGGRGRGDYRGGDRGRGGRGRGGDGYRGRGRGGGGAVNVSDTSAFPSLGAAPTASASNDGGDKW
jgi:plasminogen activator inhibitor 1 RNA-binding protein